MENGLLNFHLHLHDLGLEVLVHLVLGYFYQFLNVLLPENIVKSVTVRNLELAGNSVEISLQEGTC